MASILTELQVKYKSREKNVTSKSIDTKVVWQGSKELCEAKMNELQIGYVDPEMGSVDNLKLSQDEGPFWNLEVNYQIEFPEMDSHLGGGEAAGSSNGPAYSELTCRTMSRDIEEHTNYKKHWNNDLYCTRPCPSGSAHWPTNIWNNATAKDDKITNTSYAYPGGPDITPSAAYYFSWGQSPSDCPMLKSPYVWLKIGERTKPGVESFSWPVYELTEKSKHTSKDKAGWAVAKRAGKVVEPSKSDFGIVEKFGGSWLCEGGSVQKDGKYWLATLQDTHSPSLSGGWDPDLYPRV